MSRPLAAWYLRRERLVLGLVGFLGLLVLWEAGANAGVLKRLIFSSPSGVAQALGREVERGEIWGHLGASALEFVLGFGLAAAVGVAVGFAVGWWRTAHSLLNPWITVLYSTPIVALVPIIIVTFGIGLTSKVVVVFLISVFSIVVNTMVGVQTTGRALLDVGRIFGASERLQITSIVLPGSVPYILTGLRLAGGQATVGIVVAELIAGGSGIGFVLDRAGADLKSGLVMGMILVLGLWGVGFAEIMGRIEQRFEVWRA